MTLNPAIQNIASAHRLSLVNVCVRFLRNKSFQGVKSYRAEGKLLTDRQTDTEAIT